MASASSATADACSSDDDSDAVMLEDNDMDELILEDNDSEDEDQLLLQDNASLYESDDGDSYLILEENEQSEDIILEDNDRSSMPVPILQPQRPPPTLQQDRQLDFQQLADSVQQPAPPPPPAPASAPPAPETAAVPPPKPTATQPRKQPLTTIDASILELIDGIVNDLPEIPRSRCNRDAIIGVMETLGCAVDMETLAETVEDDHLGGGRSQLYQALKAAKAVPPVFMAKLSGKLCGGLPSTHMLPGLIKVDDFMPEGCIPLTTVTLPQHLQVPAAVRQRLVFATSDFSVPSPGREHADPPYLICGDAPKLDAPHVERMARVYARECALYPPSFLAAIELDEIVLCHSLRVGERGAETMRRDVPDTVGRRYYIDVSDTNVRRSVHDFHHELWHLADFAIRGGGRRNSIASKPGESEMRSLANLEAPDREWEKLNPPGFKYGDAEGRVGGEFMRESGVADLSSAPSEHFLNKYATSSLTEDKAETWACLVCYKHALAKSDVLRAKAALLQRRMRALCPEMDDAWWDLIRWHAFTEGKEYEAVPMGGEDHPTGSRPSPRSSRPGPSYVLYISFVHQKTHVGMRGAAGRPSPDAKPEEAAAMRRAVLAHLGLMAHEPVFAAKRLDKLTVLRDTPLPERVETLVSNFSLPRADAEKLSNFLEEILSPPDD